MREIASGKLLFVISVITGVAVWAVFDAIETEPWDSPYGWLVVAGLALILGFLGKGNPLVWPLGIFLGEVLFGLVSHVKSVLFYSGGGIDFFFPLGLIFLIPFTIPALIGSFVGFGLRKALNNTFNADTQNPRAD